MTRQHSPERSALRTPAADRVLNRMQLVEASTVRTVIELRGLGLDGLADSLNAYIPQLRQIRKTAAAQTRTEASA